MPMNEGRLEKMEEKQLAPKVFISYSHSPPEHAERVQSIAQRLAADGVDVEMDLWSVREGHDLSAFMERMTTDGTVMKVLIFSNHSYAEKADARTRGVGVEAQILSAEIYGKVQQDKFVPIVCEYGEEEKACLPTFLKGRLYIDFSSTELEAENYERLLRRIFDKPEHTKPAIGKPPTFITADTIAPNPLSTKLRSYRDALLGGKSNTRFVIEDFLDRLVELLSEHRIRDGEDEPFDEKLLQLLEEMKPLRDDLLELCDVWVRGADSAIFVTKIVGVLEQVRALGEWPEGAQTWRDSDGEGFRLLAHELFLSVLAVVLRHREFKKAAELLGARFVLPDSDRPKNRVSGSFTMLYESSDILRRRNDRLKLRRLNLQADLFKQRATTKAAPFGWLQQADLLCFVSALLFQPDEFLWYPQTLLYARYQHQGFETFQRAESIAFYNQLAPLFGWLKPDEFRQLFTEKVTASRAARWDFDYAPPSWATWLNLEKLGTQP
ncbi:MAG: toll/interleukin-1 receptor domain-containing protein [Chthoniobacteraceae bacterium]